MNQTPKPLVSVIIPSFNRESFLDRCLDSVTGQSYEHLEILLVDDHSTDQSVELARRRVTKDSRIRLLTNQHAKGISGARNTGLDAANGEFISFQDTDDTWSHDHIQDAVDCLLKFPEIDCYSANRVNISENETVEFNLFDSSTIFRELCKKQIDKSLYLIESDILDGTLDDLIIDIHTLVIRKSTTGSIRFNEERKVTNDREFVADLTWDKKRKWALRDKVCAQIYRHDGNITSDSSESCIRRLTASVDFYDRLLASDRLSTLQRVKVLESRRNRLLELPYHLRATGRHNESLALLKTHVATLGIRSTSIEFIKTVATQIQASLSSLFVSRQL